MILGIDASNLRVGGGITHLVELLRAAQPQTHGFSRTIVWGAGKTLSQIDDRPWLVKAPQNLLSRALPYRVFWQRFRLARQAKAAGCDLLFAPGGSVPGDFHPVITMSRNLLPFEWRELRRYGCSWLTLKWLLLRAAQARSFARADGLIFLTRYAQHVVSKVVPLAAATTAIIPHGIGSRFLRSPREQFPLEDYSPARPFRILYVSIVDLYKHQWHVVDAIAQLRAAGMPVLLELIGAAYPPALARLKDAQARVDPHGQFVHYRGAVPYGELHRHYGNADLCLFASSCENMPNILLEAMASGSPIACSNRGPMPEVLLDSGAYFDPENATDIARAVRELLLSPGLRARLAAGSFKRVQVYSWQRCADETFAFLATVAAVRGRGMAPQASAATSVPRGAA
ncbi:MAG: glycosyltransferase family 4 protein [Gammaproteobacteria bacterium]|nr:glycosyltransferase family 4 protein [Gammaproteobacteria bacterium]